MINLNITTPNNFKSPDGKISLFKNLENLKWHLVLEAKKGKVYVYDNLEEAMGALWRYWANGGR